MPDLLRLRQPYEDIVRLRQIAEILLRNGLGFLAEQLDLTRLLPTACAATCNWLVVSILRSKGL